MKFLALQNTYERVECALANHHEPLEIKYCDKFTASKDLISSIAALLSHHSLTIADLSFIAVNQGPGPFTTLRTVIATANGISFASRVPLVGVDGLRAFHHQCHDPQFPDTVILLNAFTNDVYYALEQKNSPLETGYQNITTLLARIAASPAERIRFLGAGTELHRALIEAQLGTRAFIPTPLPLYCSIEQIAADGLAQWTAHPSESHQIMPLYLKQHAAVGK